MNDKSNKKRPKKPLQVYLDEDQINAIRYQAEQKGTSMGHIIRESVALYLTQVPIEEDPLMQIIGIGATDIDDLAENHDHYLNKMIQEEQLRWHNDPNNASESS